MENSFTSLQKGSQPFVNKLKNKRHSYITQDMNPIDVNILNNLKADNV